MRAGVGDVYFGEAAWTQRRGLVNPEVNELVLPGASRGDGRILLARTLDECLFNPPDTGPVLRQTAPFDDDPKPFEPLGDNIRRDEVVDTRRGLGAGAG